MTRTLLAAALGLLPLVAPAAQTMRPDARPVGGTLRPTATGPAATLGLTLRATSETGVEGCTGFVTPAAPDAVVEWPGGDLRLTTLGEGFDPVLAVAGPDGVWHCNDDGDGIMPVVELRGAARGRYAVWVGAYAQDAGQQAVTLSAGMAPPVPVFNLTATPASGATRVRAGFEATDGPMSLAVDAGGGDSVAETGIVTEMPDSEFCNGYVNTAVPSAVIDYDGQGTLAFSAIVAADEYETTDLTLAIHTPGGAWRCSDDFNGNAPAIGIESAAAGRYAVWVGTYGEDVQVPSALLTVSETMPVAPEMPMEGDERVPYSDGTYMMLRPDARPAMTLRVGSEPASGTTDVLPEGANPVVGQACGGYITAAPTAAVVMSGDGPLGITATPTADGDLVLVVHTPDDRWLCSDDADGVNPGVQIGSAQDTEVVAGTYHVWVGTFTDPTGMDGMGEMDMSGMDMGDMPEPAGPTTVTLTASRAEIVVNMAGMDEDGMGMMDRPDFSPGTYDGQDLQPDRPAATLSLRDNAAETDVTVSGALINPVDGDACAGFVDARPAVAFTAGAMPVSITATSGDDTDLVMLVRTPSGGWLCSDDAGGSPAPRVDTAEAGRYAVWVGTFSRPAAPVRAHVSVGVASGM